MPVCQWRQARVHHTQHSSQGNLYQQPLSPLVYRHKHRTVEARTRTDPVGSVEELVWAHQEGPVEARNIVMDFFVWNWKVIRVRVCVRG